MKREVKLDPFFDKQPPLKFLELLRKPVHGERISSFRKREACEGEVLAEGAYISTEFRDSKGLLETAHDDFRKFLDVYGISGNRYPIIIKFGNTGCFESHRISIGKEEAVIEASDTEGIRRALIWIEDEYRRREGPCLPIGVVARSPHIRSRITRCFFSPINRPPKYGDELSDDVDYYPDEYLNRLAHDGTNGVWIYTRFSDLVYSSYIEENGTGSEARIAKLNRVITKCARYGIKVYIFAIEPMAFTDAKMSEKYPQVLGNSGSGRGYGKAFCTNTEFGRKYCVEAVKSLFKLAPGLGGFIDITMGERLTACASGFTTIKCPNCGNMPAGQVLAQTVDVLREGMREVAPEADFISWTYGHRYWDYDSIRDYVRHVPDDACVMQNFDDMLYEEQLGKTRLGVDYWLACAGPSELFRITAEEARKQSKKLFAKMQVCCSHELASVPYIPVPGILYKKYAEAFKYGVEGVMQCWYFGNYPSLMSKAAGELAFEPSFNDEEGFLRRLAGITWGRSAADDVVTAWEKFEAGYSQYPLNVMFSYYGPMHDGPVWELQLKPKNFSLPRTWQTLDPTDGDRIGEALLSGHTLEEALTLTGRIAENWSQGLKTLNGLKAADGEKEEQQSVAATLGILFNSGHNILEFYLRRDMLGRGIEPEDNLEKMRGIVLREIKNSRELTAFCIKDPRLGYHSEGEGFKFFPEKLEHRIAQLERLLKTEFPETAE
ncbi:MAG: hypothetical protein PHG48_09295, partial [Eubacteriales bacterium]|nr:hypothetical protein [Eubacteriales bacterium]